MKKRTIYAYVTTETCRQVVAEKRGALIGRDDIPVSKHSDYTPWEYGKRDILAIIAGRAPWSPSRYSHECARQVAALLGWSNA